jgi:hypothetical protein
MSPVAQSLLAAPPATGTPEPYTLARHITVRQQNGAADRQFVQVRDLGYRHTRCATIADMWTTPEGVDLWVCDLVGGGRMHCHPNRTTQCSGLDGRCSCAGEGLEA